MLFYFAVRAWGDAIFLNKLGCKAIVHVCLNDILSCRILHLTTLVFWPYAVPKKKGDSWLQMLLLLIMMERECVCRG